jgi:hypothetical protein
VAYGTLQIFKMAKNRRQLRFVYSPPRFSHTISLEDTEKAEQFGSLAHGNRKSNPSELGTWLDEVYSAKGVDYALGCIESFLLTPYPSQRTHTPGKRINPITLKVTSSDPIAVMKGFLTRAIRQYSWADEHKQRIDELRSSVSSLAKI